MTTENVLQTVLRDAAGAEALAAKATRGPWTADVPPGELWAHVCAPEGPELFKAVMHGRRPDADNARLAAAARLGWPRDSHRAAAGARLAEAVDSFLRYITQDHTVDVVLGPGGRGLQDALAAYLAECADVAREAE